MLYYKITNAIGNFRGFSTMESFTLKKTLKILKSNHKPNTAKSIAKPCP